MTHLPACLPTYCRKEAEAEAARIAEEKRVRAEKRAKMAARAAAFQ